MNNQERQERIPHGLGQPPRYQRLLILLRQGYTQRQIAAQLGVDERTVRRVIRKLAPEAVS
jgi:DNA-binding NarL/FixJ family response regulator